MKGKFSLMWRVAIALVLALSLSLVMAVPVSAQGALADVTATPVDSTQTVTTTYTLAFTTATPGEIATVDILFGSDFDVSSAAKGTVSGIGAGTVTNNGTDTVTYTVTDPEVITAGTAITIALSGIGNPAVVDDYTVAVTTRNPATGAIDTGSDDVTITPKPVSFEVVAGTVTVGEAFSVTITAKDAAEGGGDPVAGYAGNHLIDFTYDPTGTGTLPAFEVISFADGIGISSQSFILTDVTQTDAQIKADDTALDVVGFSAVITINPGALAGFTISGEPSSAVEAGTAFTNITVTAVDADDEPVTDYTGTVSWSSTDPSAELPADYTFIAEDDGEKLFDGAADFILKTVLLEEGTPIATTITITDETAGVSKESIDITVGPATASQWTVEAAPTSIRADNINESMITATAYDQFDNVATGITGSAGFTASLGSIATSAAFVEGVAETALTSTAVGTATVKVTDREATVTIVDYTELALDTVTITVDGTTNVLTEGTDWQDATSNTATATSLASAIDALTGVSASSSAAVVTITADVGSDITTLTTSDAVNMTVTPNLPYATITVSLMAPDLLAEVWVATDGADANAGTEAAPFVTITAAIAATAEGGIVNVAAGTYAEAVTIAKQLTLKGANYGVSAVTGDRGPESIIDGSAIALVVEISASGVILDGLMIEGKPEGYTYAVTIAPGSTTDGVQIRNNIIYGAYLGIFARPESDGIASNWVISNNTVTSVGNGTAITLKCTGTTNTISGNLVGDGGITIGGTMVNTTIENNTISNTNDGGSGVSLSEAADGVTITGNTFSGELLNGNGVRIWSGATKVSTYAIHQNNFISDFGVGSGFAVNNGTVDQVDATNNWWGDDSGPEDVLNPDGIGEPIDGNVAFTPWLTAAYAEPVAPFTSIGLESGWNFISVPKRMAAATDTFGELLDGVDVAVAYSYDPVSGWSSALTDATPVEVLEGYWIDVNTAGTVTLSYKEAAQEVPASKSLVGDAWNAIGFSSTTARDADTALMSVDGSWSTVLGWDAEGQAYEDSIIVTGAGDMSPGKGYWIWMTENDVLSAISG